ncbi:hypothetical protein B0A50_00978 [Salinomyces thailandicus]|uniref:Phosphoglycerate mutase n=1 Tax=Salinomyces thailandicus TaxID=706561 RepID=A0A4U0UBD5_9PEZI|nr:hypothetical protein B0A50_00978 [Salinomyces thailandica]
MKLFLVRHGETVDNVAGLYAGVLDSALTNHGVDQARRLGEYFSKAGVTFSHIFSSPLSRALKTAEAVQRAQNITDAGERAPVDIVKVPDLIEQDFGFYEGKPFYARSDPKKSGREAHYAKHKDNPGFVDVESKESMGNRADGFLDQQFIPLLAQDAASHELVVAVISHGMLLSHLWRRLLLRLPRKSLTITPEVTAARGSVVLEHLGGWSNTGYLELALTKKAAGEGTVTEPSDVVSSPAGKTPNGSPPALCLPLTTLPGEASADRRTLPQSSPGAPAPVVTSIPPPPAEAAQDNTEALSIPATPAADVEDAEATTHATAQIASAVSPLKAAANGRTLHGWSTTILAIDSKQHLIGLKRQRGGIGRLAHDEGQKKLDSFFSKRQKTS